MQEITEEEALDLLRSSVPCDKSITALAVDFNVSRPFMSRVLAGKKRMTEPMLSSIGVVRRDTYWKVEG